MSELFPRSRYLINPVADHLVVERGKAISGDLVLDAIDRAHALLDQFAKFDVDVFGVLGMRNLSAFIGELLAASVVKVAPDMFRKNPHQDGYPDLLLMDEQGQGAWSKIAGRYKEKAPFSPFPTGGIEIKATCGSVPSPAQLAKKALEKPGMGDGRAALLTGYDWKAHHRDTNNLLGLFWDFIGGVPRIVAAFYRHDLAIADWGAIIQPKEGGGRTTSVSIMTRSGVRKMFDGWVVMLNEPVYIDFFEKRNTAKLLLAQSTKVGR